MKNYILLILLFCINTCLGNALDKVRTKQDLYKFLPKYIDWDFGPTLFSGYTPDPETPVLSNHIGSDSFYIADIDRNGFNDLIIDGREFYIFMGKRHNNFDFFQMGSMTVKYTVLGIREKDSVTYIQVRVMRSDRGSSAAYDEELIYKDHSFQEYIATPSTHSIERIDYLFRPGFYFGAESYTLEIKRSHPEFKRLSALLNGMRFTELSDDYSSIMSCVSNSTLTIYYDNGKEKHISDWGHVGPLRLQYFFKQLEAIQEAREKRAR